MSAAASKSSVRRSLSVVPHLVVGAGVVGAGDGVGYDDDCVEGDGMSVDVTESRSSADTLDGKGIIEIGA